MNTPSASPKKYFQWRVRYSVLSILWVSWLFSFLDRMVISVSLPFIGADFQLDAASQGIILSAFFGGYALYQIPGGMLADRFGSRRVMAFAIAWWSVFTSLTGMALSYPVLLVCRFVFGVGEGCFPGASWKTTATYFPSKERATATAIQSSVNTLGPAVASLVAAGVIAAFGWRAVFIALGIPGIAVTLLILFYIKDNPLQHPGMTTEELNELNIDAQEASIKNKIQFKQFLQTKILWQMVFIWFLFDITFWGFVSWLPSYLMKIRGFSVIKTGILGSLPFFIGTIGMLAGGYLSDKFKGYRKWLFIPNTLVAAGFLYLTYSVTSADWAVVFQCVSALFMFLAFAAFWGLVIDAIPPEIMGASSGTVNFGGQLAGFVSPILMGYLIDVNEGSFDMAFMLLIIAAVGSALLALTVENKTMKEQQS